MTEQAVTHHRPQRVTVGPEAATSDDPCAVFTRRIADRLSCLLVRPLETVCYRSFPATAPAELDGWTRHEITIDGHEVIITGTLDQFGLSEYRISVDDQTVPWHYTLNRTITDVLADAAHQAITSQRSA
jgi:hypothetical protein